MMGESFHFRAIDIQGLIGNVGGYIGLFLGYSFLQIPDFILLTVLNAKRWFVRIREGKDQNQTGTIQVTVQESISASQDRSKRRSNGDWAGNECFADINVHHKTLITRIEQLEKSTKSTQQLLRSLERNRKI